VYVGTDGSAAALLALAACGGGGSNAGGGTVSAVSYSGPGSRWDADLATDGSFTITRRDSVSAPVDLTVNGSYEGLASGFLKLTMASASGTNAPSAGDITYTLDVPGYALMLKPLDAGNDQIIPMVRSGECPTVDMDANLVMVKKDDGVLANDAGREFFGTFHDNLNTHKLGSLYDAFEPAEARRIADRLEIHCTPKHGSWLDMAEIEIGVLARQCLDRRLPDQDILKREITLSINIMWMEYWSARACTRPLSPADPLAPLFQTACRMNLA